MIITISGLSGSGKTTAADLLAKRLGAKTIDVGGIFRREAKRRGMDVIEFGRYAEAHPGVDKQLDRKVLEIAKRGKTMIWQARLSGWLAYRHGIPSIRLWIHASPEVRARRVSEREGISAAQALRDITRRDRDNARRFRGLYGLDLNDLSVYDTVVRTDNLTIRQVVSALLRSIVHLWPKNRRTSRQPLIRRKAPARRPRRP